MIGLESGYSAVLADASVPEKGAHPEIAPFSGVIVRIDGVFGTILGCHRLTSLAQEKASGFIHLTPLILSYTCRFLHCEIRNNN